MNAGKKLRREERRMLQIRTFQMKALVDRILREEFHRRIFRLKKVDEYRLLTLDIWRRRYKVSIRFILQILIPYYEKQFAKYKSRSSLGVRVATLVGVHSEKVLKEALDRLYPDAEQISEWRWRKREEIIQQREGEDEFAPREKNILDFGTPDKFANYYKREVLKKRRDFDKALQNSDNKIRPYRDNPWS